MRRSSDTDAPPPRAFRADDGAFLRDAQGRVYNYLRLSLTDHCDLACVYCMPPSGEEDHAVRSELLSADEVVRLVRVCAMGGITRVRFTGGEPLVRKDIVEIVSRVSRELPSLRLVMTTNATRLAELAAPLRAAGLSAVNVSVDSFDADTFRRMTRGGDLAAVLRGVEAALAVGMTVKLNTVVVSGQNEHELPAIVSRAWSMGVVPRFIELMPLGEGAKLGAAAHVSVTRMLEILDGVVGGARESVHGLGPARYARARDGSQRKVGFITAMSDTFCDSCNRIRITARGDLRACLASRRAISLRDAMRRGDDDRSIAWSLLQALAGKEDGHFFLDESVREHENVGMSLVGG